jgi:hypothetical protein
MSIESSFRPVSTEPNPEAYPPRPGPALVGSDPANDTATPETPGAGADGSHDHQANGSASVETAQREAASATLADDDPFNPDRLRLSQDFAAAVGVRKLLTTIPVRKPSKEWFVRTHPDVAYRLQTRVLELKEDREIYLVSQHLWHALASEPTFSPRLLVTAINRQGVLFLWPIRLPGPDGKIDDWSRSAMEVAETAREQWVRVSANMSLGAYDIAVAAHQAEPQWPALAMGEILKIGSSQAS